MIYSILISIFLGLIALTTAVGNLIVILAFYYDKKLRTTNDYFIMNMAIADFLVGSFCIPFYIPFNIKQSWPFGRLFCQIWVTIDDVATMASVINIVAISVNRYWLIAYPTSYRKSVRQNLVYLVMITIWLFSFINFAPGIWLISFFDKVVENANDCSGDYNRSFVYMLIAQFNYFVWPFLVLCILNVLIMLNIWKRTRKMTSLKSFSSIKSHCQPSQNLIKNKKDLSKNKFNQSKTKFHEQRKCPSPCQEMNRYRRSLLEQSSPMIEIKHDKSIKLNENSIRDYRSFPSVILSMKSSNVNCENNIIDYRLSKEIEIKEIRRISQKDLRINRDRKSARSLFILVIVFLIFLFPYVICSIISTAGFQISPTIFQISFWLLWINSTCNPFLYPFIQNKYRRAYNKLFKAFFKHFHFKSSNNFS